MSVTYDDLCGCTGITSTRGAKGDTGSAGATGTPGTPGAQGDPGDPPPTYDFGQAYTSSNDIYAGGTGYDYQISASMPAGTNAFYNMTFVVSATDSHTIITYPVVNGVLDATYQTKTFQPAAGGTGYITITLSGWIAYTAGNTFKMHIESSGAAVTPRLKTVTGWFYTV